MTTEYCVLYDRVDPAYTLTLETSISGVNVVLERLEVGFYAKFRIHEEEWFDFLAAVHTIEARMQRQWEVENPEEGNDG